MRVVNLNAWIGHLVRGAVGAEPIEPPGHKQRRQNALIAELRDRDPDVITLQECLPLPGFARDIAKALDYDLLYRVANSGIRVLGVGLPTGIGSGEGLAILARRSLRMRPLQTIRLSGPGFVNRWASLQVSPNRFAIAACVWLRGRPMVVATTHVRYGFPSRDAFFEGWRSLQARGVVRAPTPPERMLKMMRRNQRARDLELRRLGGWIRKLRQRDGGTPVVLGADLNLDPGAPLVTTLEADTGCVNALPRLAPGRLTWDPATNTNIAFSMATEWQDGTPKPRALQLMAYLDAIPQTPDHILVSDDLSLIGAEVAFDQPRGGVFASDHFGVQADVELM